MRNIFRFGNSIEAGKRQYSSGYFDKAVILFEDALQQNPNDFESAFWLGRAFVRSGKQENAKKMFVKCIELRPELEKILLVEWLHEMNVRENECDSLDKITNERLEKLHFEKCIQLKDIGQFIGIYFSFMIVWAFFRKLFSIDVPWEMRFVLEQAVWSMILVGWIIQKTILRDNLFGFFLNAAE